MKTHKTYYRVLAYVGWGPRELNYPPICKHLGYYDDLNKAANALDYSGFNHGLISSPIEIKTDQDYENIFIDLNKYLNDNLREYKENRPKNFKEYVGSLFSAARIRWKKYLLRG